MQIDRQTIEQAILNFLTAQYNKKTEKEQKQLDKAIADNDVEKVAQLQAVLKTEQEKYQKDIRLTYMADWMSKQLSFGTHISKGIHSSSKGDNLIFDVKHQIEFAGHHNLDQAVVDASGNAAALPLAAFLNYIVVGDVTVGQMIAQKHSALKGVFHSDEKESDRIQTIFYQLVLSQIDQPRTDERNKQILWAKCNEDYVCLVPLYPISVAHYVYKTIQEMRFSEQNVQARKNRGKANALQQAYPSLHDLAVVNIGGSNPQGVSQLMSKQSGKNYLLPSLPPIFRSSGSISIPKNTKSIFDLKALDYHARFQLQSLFEIIKNTTNNVKIRDARKATLDEIIYKVSEIATGIKNTRPAGWSKDYPNLKMAQKYWLDPNRGELQDEEEFKQSRELGDWREEREIAFAEWLQRLLKLEFNKIAHEFGEPEQYEWRDEFKDEIKKSVRLGNGVF